MLLPRWSLDGLLLLLVWVHSKFSCCSEFVVKAIFACCCCFHVSPFHLFGFFLAISYYGGFLLVFWPYCPFLSVLIQIQIHMCMPTQKMVCISKFLFTYTKTCMHVTNHIQFTDAH